MLRVVALRKPLAAVASRVGATRLPIVQRNAVRRGSSVAHALSVRPATVGFAVPGRQYRGTPATGRLQTAAATTRRFATRAKKKKSAGKKGGGGAVGAGVGSGPPAALRDALKQVESMYGKGAIMQLGSSDVLDVESVSTGSITLDRALGVGGLPRGRVVEVYGGESSGKTTLALHAISEVQKLGGECAFIDVEHAMDPT